MVRTRSSTLRSPSPASRDSSPTKAVLRVTPSGMKGAGGGRRRRSSSNPEHTASPSRHTRSQRSLGVGGPLTMLSFDGITSHAQSFDSLWGGVKSVLEDEDKVKEDGIIATPATRPSLTHFIKPRRRKRDIARPFVMKGLMSGVIYMMGEAIAGGLLCRNGQYGVYPGALMKKQVLHSALVGGLANGPMLQLFFMAVDYFVRFESRVLNVATKVFIDQVVWGCFWNWCYILLMNIATDSPGFGYIGEGLGDHWHVRLLKGFGSAFWKASDFWLHVKLLTEGLKMLPMDVMCYAFVPCSLRPLWVAAVDTLWVTILSQYD
eukprot:CAMPEP_0173444110 /NCGR_PEP_ID=MMETSP1357-20121228/31505_1 /TAXON_ID=77926 /ORGANISM="Hemiselmis rufescens, Strain PCC563" /LENGTH=318 /DNA_ID=CAMNT_0014410117 /DNA_START=331 /DNA_END=1287 /DNA_ORIENTATION=-